MRLKSVRRISHVQRQLQRVAEWKLQELRQQEDELRVAQQQVIGALNEETGLHGQFVHAMARHLTQLAVQSDSLAASRKRQDALVREQTGRLKQAERMENAVAREDARTREKEALSDLIDMIAGHPGTSLP